MEEQKKERTLVDVEQEYAMFCQRLGHAEYQIYVIGSDIGALKEKLKELNLEAAAIKGREVKKDE